MLWFWFVEGLRCLCGLCLLIWLGVRVFADCFVLLFCFKLLVFGVFWATLVLVVWLFRVGSCLDCWWYFALPCWSIVDYLF